MDDVVAARHGLGFADGIGDDATAGEGANAELAGGRFVIRVTKTVADASAFDGVRDKLYAPVIRGRNDRDDTRAEGELRDQDLCIGLDARNAGGVLIIPKKENGRAEGEAGSLPLSKRKEAENA